MADFQDTIDTLRKQALSNLGDAMQRSLKLRSQFTGEGSNSLDTINERLAGLNITARLANARSQLVTLMGGNQQVGTGAAQPQLPAATG
jgi:hypothetical protein